MLNISNNIETKLDIDDYIRITILYRLLKENTDYAFIFKLKNEK